MEKRMKYIYWVCFVLLIVWIAFLSFYRLDVKYVDPWDEARHGVNAYEMANGGNLFQNTYLRQADYYNLKPPLSMWCIMLGMAVFGNGVFALRFYSALCYVILAVVAGNFLRRYGKLESLLGVAFLAINTTAFQAHMIRAGDADSLFVLLFSLAMFCMMQIPNRPKMLYLCGLFFSLAFLAKSYHAGVIAVIGGLYLILTGQIRRFCIRQWGLFAASIAGLILLWAVPRMMVDGLTFFRKMWETDVLGRTDGTLQNNIAPFMYYLEYYFGAASGKVSPYLCALVIGIVGVFVFSRSFVWKKREQYIGWVLWIVVPLFAFSCVTNKLLWYVYPSLVALLLGAGVMAARLIKNSEILPMLRVVLTVVVAFVFLHYSAAVVETIHAQGPNVFQDLVRQMAQDEKYKGCNIYVDYEVSEEGIINSTWSQQDVFVAEAYGDFVCIDDGLMGIMLSSYHAQKTGLLFVSDQVYEQKTDLYKEYTCVAEKDGYRVYEISY